MDLGGMPARLDPASLDLDRSLRDRLSRFAIERRSTDGWSRVAVAGWITLGTMVVATVAAWIALAAG